ncbi:MAG: hypothetical protein LBL72_08070 [Candidatus Accumulibacter sp.]|jgi:hypothetical protein|nr:hypothetical protein [Accumulibacter sp.]
MNVLPPKSTAPAEEIQDLSQERLPDGRTRAEYMEHMQKNEYRRGYPKASEEEIQILYDAQVKTGEPAWNLEMAKALLRMSEADQKRFWRTGQGVKGPMLEKVGYFGFPHWDTTAYQFPSLQERMKAWEEEDKADLRQIYRKANEEEIQAIYDAEQRSAVLPENAEMAKAMLKMPEAEQKRFWSRTEEEKAEMLKKTGYPGYPRTPGYPKRPRY